MMRRLILLVVLFPALAAPALAHKLKVFATVQGDVVRGYAFFIGGGRARHTPWIAKTADGVEIARGETDAEGNFRLVPPQPVAGDVTVTVDTREGHIASALIPASRFGAAGTTGPLAAAAAEAPPGSLDTTATGGTAATLQEATAAAIEAAVQRQIEPLLERIEAMDSRLRFTDILSGMFLIVGLAGIALWARSRAR